MTVWSAALRGRPLPVAASMGYWYRQGTGVMRDRVDLSQLYCIIVNHKRIADVTFVHVVTCFYGYGCGFLAARGFPLSHPTRATPNLLRKIQRTARTKLSLNPGSNVTGCMISDCEVTIYPPGSQHHQVDSSLWWHSDQRRDTR